jgi:hypothetical protein
MLPARDADGGEEDKPLSLTKTTLDEGLTDMASVAALERVTGGLIA